MTDFFDWLTVGDSGVGADRLANAFNLSHEEVRGTAEALAPAFTIALQRAMSDPSIWQNLSRQFAPLIHQATAPGPETAASKAAQDFSDTLFGTPEISAAIARKVSLAKGIAPDAVEQLMRNLSIMTMQTMVQMMLANMARSQPKGFAEGDYLTAMAEMMRRAANAVDALARPSEQMQPQTKRSVDTGSALLSNLFADALKGTVPFLPPIAAQMSGSDLERSQPSSEKAQPLATPFDAMMQGFMRGFSGAGTMTPAEHVTNSEPEKTRQPNEMRSEDAARSSQRSMAAGETGDKAGFPGFDDLARVSRQMQDDYARQLMELFVANGDVGAGPTKH